MSDLRRNYELAFHINQNLEESRIMAIAEELKEKLIKGGATISFAKEPERQRLSYEIKHNAGSFFGYIQFNITDDGEDSPAQTGLAGVEEYIKLNNDILRSLIIRLPSDAQKSQALERQMRAKERLEKRAQAVTKGTPVVPNEKLDKELENIIDKL
jgi:ribosomal protein S6